MKKQRVDYTGLSLRTLKDPRFSHLLLIIGWPVYFLFFFITENLIPAERFHVIHCALDDLIPFNEFFLIFYGGWYLLIAGALLYGLLYDVERFREMQTYIIITQVIGVVIYLIYPSVQLLRPEVFPRQNILTAIMGMIYAFDTNTGVFPSMHVAFSLAVLSVGLKDRQLKPVTRAGLLFVVVMICLAVCFVKQHSALDILGAAAVCLVAEIIVFGRKYWVPRFSKTTEPSYEAE
ncbi:MAG: phosphatidic acid phosphatase [Lachnospiraceae bacterium]|nr:phosphatidic acid phosphatase [Lachnospiraceae bacterium]